VARLERAVVEVVVHMVALVQELVEDIHHTVVVEEGSYA